MVQNNTKREKRMAVSGGKERRERGEGGEGRGGENGMGKGGALRYINDIHIICKEISIMCGCITCINFNVLFSLFCGYLSFSFFMVHQQSPQYSKNCESNLKQ